MDNASPYSTDGTAVVDLVEKRTQQAIVEMLGTDSAEVYSISQDGTTYIRPSALRSVPVQKITEDSNYWNPTWTSLDYYLSQEQREEELLKEWVERVARDPNNAKVRKQRKEHQDNVSKHRKIKEIFGPGTDRHPNQLVAKQHLPEGGLCQQELMYKMACKVSDLQELYDRRELSMAPWDFYRWRVSRKLDSFLRHPGDRGGSVIKAIAVRLCDDCSSSGSEYEDRLLRRAILHAASYKHTRSSYGAKAGKGKFVKAKSLAARLGQPAQRVQRRLPAVSSQAPALSDELRPRKKVQSTVPSTYQGINAYRAQSRRENQQP